MGKKDMCPHCCERMAFYDKIKRKLWCNNCLGRCKSKYYFSRFGGRNAKHG